MFQNCGDQGFQAQHKDLLGAEYPFQDIPDCFVQGNCPPEILQALESEHEGGEGSAPEPAPRSDSSDPYVTEVLGKLESAIEKSLDKMDRGQSYPYWSLADNLRTAQELYHLSQDPRVLVFLLEAGEALLERISKATGQKDVLYNKPVYAWITGNYSCGRTYGHLVHSMILMDNTAFAMNQLLRSGLANTYRRRIENVTRLYEKVFAHFDSDFVASRYTYVFSSREGKLSSCKDNDFAKRKGTPLPLNMNTAAGLAHFQMYRLNAKLGNTQAKLWHKRRFGAISTLVKRSFNSWRVGNRTGYTWLYIPGGRVEDS
ncbi:MAG: hypothetical protein H6624_00005, partial [Bdellovibrionaceae bacterium]|nr:hypothetical protein [Pseudobdellovibrionaceae bacterium]